MTRAATPAPRISVVAVFHNMRREAVRTLHSLTHAYQRDIAAGDYEVIAVDSGSTEPLDASTVTGLGPDFRYIQWETSLPSPCGALNHGVQLARAPLVVCLIDGARILSPCILKYTLEAASLHAHPFVYTFAMHLGSKPQYQSVEEGYNQEQEDTLLASVDWAQNGYRLFDISSVAGSSGNGFFSQLHESNCFAMRRNDYVAIGGLDERFDTPGGGLANLDFFNRVHEHDALRLFMLLGEATFHQFHGGVATNAPISRHPWNAMVQDYARIKGRPFDFAYRRPEYFGGWPSECERFLKA